MLRITRFSGFFSAAMFVTVLVILSPSFQSEAIRSSHRFSFRKAPPFRNAAECASVSGQTTTVCDPSLVHVAITLDVDYLRGSIAAVHSILHNSLCPENIFFHFLVSDTNLQTLVESTFPNLKFNVYFFDPNIVAHLISSSVRQALEQPLNYARNYLVDLLESCVERVIYLDSDLVVVDDVAKLWSASLDSRAIGAPEYCHANFTKYFTAGFWSESRLSGTFAQRRACYFNTGVMVMDLVKWRKEGYTKRIERWMEIQKSDRIYELGSLPPFLLVFAGHVAPIEHRWNQHGLGGDNVKGSCRDLHPGPVSLLHWSGSASLRSSEPSAPPLAGAESAFVEEYPAASWKENLIASVAALLHPAKLAFKSTAIVFQTAGQESALTESFRTPRVNLLREEMYDDGEDEVVSGPADRISNSGPSLGEEYAVAQRPKAIVHRTLVFMAACSEKLQI